MLAIVYDEHEFADLGVLQGQTNLQASLEERSFAPQHTVPSRGKPEDVASLSPSCHRLRRFLATARETWSGATVKIMVGPLRATFSALLGAKAARLLLTWGTGVHRTGPPTTGNSSRNPGDAALELSLEI